MERMKNINLNGTEYIVKHDASNGTLIIEKKQEGRNIKVDMNSNIEEYRKVLEEYQKTIKKDELEVIIDEIKSLIDNMQIKSMEDLYQYYNTKGYSFEQIAKFNEQILPYAETKFNQKNIYSDVFDTLCEELDKNRQNDDALNISFYKENGLLKIDAKRTINGVQNYLFDKEISFDYTEELEKEFINKFAEKFAERHHHTEPEINNYGIEYADLHMFSSSNATFDIKGISQGYASELDKNIKQVPIKSNVNDEVDNNLSFNENMTYDDFVNENKGIANNPEYAKNQYEEYRKRFMGRTREMNNKGNIILKIFIILVVEAAIALALITYLLIK